MRMKTLERINITRKIRTDRNMRDKHDYKRLMELLNAHSGFVLEKGFFFSY